MKREEFLKAFLGALGAAEVVFKETTDAYVKGTVIYDASDPEEVQDFCWNKPQNSEIPRPVYNLACLLHEQGLLDIDKITVSRAELRDRYNTRWKTHLSQTDFHDVVDALEQVIVTMVDDGKSTGIYYIHE